MTQEEKDLLIKDLCARLFFGVKVLYNTQIFEVQYIEPMYEEIKLLDNENYTLSIDEVKPYLFPLSSMTEEQKRELRNLIYEYFTLDEEFNEGLCYKTYGDILVWLDEKPINECYFIFDYFNKNHFDYRGLINKGLAIDATGLNIY